MERNHDLNRLLEEYKLQRAKWQARYPTDLPNDVCHHAFIKGLSIENSFAPSVGDYFPLFGNGYETVYIWTHKQDKHSAIVVDVKRSVKNQPSWRTIIGAIRLALRYSEAFESVMTSTDYLVQRSFNNLTISQR